MDVTSKMTFPKQIGFTDVAAYVEQFTLLDHSHPIVFDLRETVDIHSSFIGFLLHSKTVISRQKGNLILLLSYTLEKVLIMANLTDYFTVITEDLTGRKSA